jgi:nicotinamide-nucleotide amidase
MGDHLDTLAGALPPDIDAKVTTVLQRVCALGLKLATAESCTGGLLASALTDVKGCSHAFDRAFVTYTDEAKAEMLGVPHDLIQAETAVSKLVAIGMAEGALQRSNADICIAITGYADDADGAVPAGVVHFALALRRRPTEHAKHEFGDLGRGGVRTACIRTALQMIEHAISAREAILPS